MSNPKRTASPALLATLMGVLSGFTLMGYECIRSASNTLLKVAVGMESFPWVMAFVPAVVWGCIVLFGAALSRFGPRRALVGSMTVSGTALLACWWGTRQGWAPAAIALYWVREAYIVLLIEQYWSFLNSTFRMESAQRWNGPIIGISSLGSILGGELVHRFAVPWGTAQIVIVGAVTLIPAAAVALWAYGQVDEPAPERREDGGPLHLSLFQESPLLRGLFFIVLASQVVSTATGLAFQTELHRAFSSPDAETAFSGRFYSVLNGGAALLQFVLTPILLARGWGRGIHYALPLLSLLAGLWLVGSPSLLSAGLALFLFKALDYSLFRAAKELLYIPLSFDERFRAKEVIDAFGYRLGKGGASLAIGLFQGAAGMATGPLGVVSATAALAWFAGVRTLFRRPVTT